ncbi:MAG: MotA/TolQ/ExbB proton channel family protein [Candidatus Aminicenantes bacterium]|nr:MotA/TolQ/ExbB proton channel family protein [Candidatus Aminicenantes bacterium]MDH5714150.1 MotA/TolQ/ExbB proton channel family protein [Candidatus Aminicenantes bacterium]
MTLIEFLKAGGIVMIPLIFCSLLALAIIIEKLLNLRPAKIIDSKKFETIVTLIEGGMVDKAKEVCRKNPEIMGNMIGAVLENRHLERDEIKGILADVGRQEVSKLEKHLGILGTVAGVSPLLGLLGTVAGMIRVFKIIAVTGVGEAGALSGGISEALITTATGLSIAIPTLVMYNLFNDRAEKIILELENYSLKVMQIVKKKEEEKRLLPADKAME